MKEREKKREGERIERVEIVMLSMILVIFST